MEPWFRLREVQYSNVEQLRAVLEAFRRRELDGILIRGVYPADEMAGIATRIEKHDPPFYVYPPRKPLEVVKTYKHLYGVTLVAADMNEYFDAAANFRANCRVLFEEIGDFEERMHSLFTILGDDRPVVLPVAHDGQPYMSATIRILPRGSGIDLHCDNNLSHHHQYDHLRTVCDIDGQLSYFLTIAAPEEGGELVVYERQWTTNDDAPTEFVMAKDEEMVRDRASCAIKPGPGDVILFAGGRIYHQVLPTRSPRPRLTIGGFLADGRGDDRLYYWS